MATRRAPGKNKQKSTVVPASNPRGPLPRRDRTDARRLGTKVNTKKR